MKIIIFSDRKREEKKLKNKSILRFYKMEKLSQSKTGIKKKRGFKSIHIQVKVLILVIRRFQSLCHPAILREFKTEHFI